VAGLPASIAALELPSWVRIRRDLAEHSA